MAYIEVCGIDDIPGSSGCKGKKVTVGGKNVALFKSGDGTVYAIENRCPHMGAPLSEGRLEEGPDGPVVTCMLHGKKTNLENCQMVAPAQGSVEKYSVEVKDGRVSVEIPE